MPEEMRPDYLRRFGKLIDDGDSGNGKITYVVSDKDDGWRSISIEIDTDDCDAKHAKAFKAALIEIWNSQDATP